MGNGERDALAHRRDHRRVGHDRSRHQGEPLPRANRLNVLDDDVEAASLATADREKDEPEQRTQPVQCSVFTMLPSAETRRDSQAMSSSRSSAPRA